MYIWSQRVNLCILLLTLLVKRVTFKLLQLFACMTTPCVKMKGWGQEKEGSHLQLLWQLQLGVGLQGQEQEVQLWPFSTSPPSSLHSQESEGVVCFFPSFTSPVWGSSQPHLHRRLHRHCHSSSSCSSFQSIQALVDSKKQNHAEEGVFSQKLHLFTFTELSLHSSTLKSILDTAVSLDPSLQLIFQLLSENSTNIFSLI